MNLCVDPACPAPVHDTSSGYVYGCRSDQAKRARRHYKKLRSVGAGQRTLPSWPYVRRLRALSALGWSWPALSARTGIHDRTLSFIANEERERIHVDTIAILDKLWRDLQAVPGTSLTSKGWARKRGWAPPLAWDDIDDPKEKPKFGEDELGQYRRKQAKQVAKRGAA